MRTLLGTDPELFVLGPDNIPVPAHKVGIPDKNNKLVVDGGKVFRDGYAIELNVRPSPNWYTIADRLQRTLWELEQKLPEDYKMLTCPAVKIDLVADLQDAPEDVVMFGCDPSYCAYSGNKKIPDLVAMDHPHRYAGGHLHFSAEGVKKGSQHWTTRFEDVALFMRMMDAYVGLPFTCLFFRPQQFERRKYYGQAGEFRMQTYADGSLGVEYRTLGPEVINHPALLNLAFGVGKSLFENFHAMKKQWIIEAEPYVRDAINTGEKAMTMLQSLPDFYSSRLIRAIAEDGIFYALDTPYIAIERGGWKNAVQQYLWID